MRTVQQNAQEKHHCSALYNYCLVLSVSVDAYLLKTNIATNIALATAPLNMYVKNSELRRSAQKILLVWKRKMRCCAVD
jgi:hypothetical protein